MYDVEQVLKNLKNNKATGLDNIAYEHLKYGGECLKDHMTKLFNLVYFNTYSPKSWKMSLIVPLFKGGDKCKSDPNSYRGISLAPCIGKVYDKIIDSKLQLNKDNKCFPNPQQTAYQQGVSCLHTSFNIHESIYHHLERLGNILLILLDSTKAFDTVWHSGLLYKLSEYGVKGKLWLLIANMYSDTHSAVLFNGQISRRFQIKRGVRQGSSLSSKLYLLYINDLLEQLSERKCGILVSDIRVSSPV